VTVFAFLALVCFIFAAFGVAHFWIFGTTALGLVFVAAHLLLADGISWRRPRP
jgi:hypothetical protein